MAEPVAIVGMACRFPGGEDLASFRALLHAGRCAIGPVPQARLEGALRNHRITAGGLAEHACRWGGFLDGIDRFDAAFFRISPVEARLLDPQQRLLLETSWWALEDAGIDPAGLSGTRTGIFVGISTSDYRELIVDDDASLGLHAATGTSPSTAAGRIAFTLGLQGPAMALDTSSSSSLVAVHQAVSAVQSKEADLALAGGVNAILSTRQTAALANAGMLSPDGVCRTFDAGANGYVRGEGCGVIVLRRLADAEASGSRILGVIRGSAVNQDGAGPGLTVPNPEAQARVIGEALARAGIEPSEVDYLEAHGTGTKIGDPIEIASAAVAYGAGREAERPLLVGSVKTNIGHLEAAAGIAGLIKVVLALQDGVIPAHLNFETPRPDIDWASIPVRVTTTSTPWPNPADRRRRAGTSSFGSSGTNAHVVIEEYREAPAPGSPVGREPPVAPCAPCAHEVRVLPLSGRSTAAVRALAGRYRDWLADRDEDDSRDEDDLQDRLADLAWTAGVGRHHFAYRTGLAFAGADELRASLEEVASGSRAIGRGSASRVGFLFTGQGSQWAGMGRRLYESEPVVRSVLDRCDRVVGELLGGSLLAVMFGDEGDPDDTTWTQPALYALECGLCAWWERLGVRPDAVLGHSVGEIAAAQVAGVFSLEDGARFAARRGALMGGLSRDAGAMTAVFAPVGEVRRALGDAGGVTLAAENGSHCVVSGPSSAVAALERTFRSAGVRVQGLRTSHAFHSALMEPALDGIEASAAALPAATPAVPLVGNLTGAVLEAAPDGHYWRRQARETVRFSSGVATLRRLGIDLLIEVGPSPVLAPLAQACWTGGGEPQAIASLDRDGSIGEAVAAAYEAGLTLSFEALFAGETRRRIAAPAYPFQRRRHWLDAQRRPSIGAEPFPEDVEPIPEDAESGPQDVESIPQDAESGPEETAPPRREPDLPTRLKEADDPEASLTTFLGEQIQAVLGLDDPPPSDVGFFDLGLDSLLASQLRKRINRALAGAFEVSSTALFGHPDTGSLARHLARGLHLRGEAPGAAGAVTVDAPVAADAPVAIVGMACRFPGGGDLSAFQKLLEAGTEAISQAPADRPDLTGRNAPDAAPIRGGFIDGIDEFDAEFFRIAPVEARLLDPQQRLLLETSWRALEDAGIAPDRLRGSRTGVYAGVFTSDYRDLMVEAAAMDSAYAATGVSAATAVGRVAFALGLEGPAIAVDTACSSSLVALHQAASALRRGEADLALAGGVNAILSVNQMAAFGDAGMLAPDGRCKTFDARADGYVRGEGCGMIVLRRLAEAQAAGDRILAVIRGSAVNQDGASAGLTVPNGQAQERVIRAALAQAGVAPSGVDYLEAHGTGTALGDPIEIEAACAVYGEGRPADRPLLVGSVKTNIGHLEAAAGIAGVVKVVLALRRGTIPRHLHFETPNPRLDWSSLPVRVAAQATPWPEDRRRPPRAGVSSFGFSGTNAHVVVEGWRDAPAPPLPLPESVAGAPGMRPARLLPLSGRTPAAVRTLAGRYAAWLSREGEAPSFACLSDLAWTAAIGRSHFPHRTGLVFRDGDELRDRLTAVAAGTGAVEDASASRVGFLFTGQGSQWPGMGRELYESEPVFRSVLDRCDRVVRELRGISLREAMFGGGGADLHDTVWTQPCLYALACGLAALWESVGVRPVAVLGHSVGELAAARTAGAFTLEDGARFAALRGSLMGGLPRGKGSMAAVFAPEAEVRRAVRAAGEVSLAAENGSHCVISGEAGAVTELGATFRAAGVRVEGLRTSHAFHSAQMEPVLDEIESCAPGITTDAPPIPLVSTVTGRVPEGMPDGAYWRRQAREAVRFSSAVATMRGLGVDLLIEIGPDSVLGPLARGCWPDGNTPPTIASLTRRGSFAEAIAAAYEAGLPLSLESLFSGEERRRIAIPGYPFEPRRHWLDQGEGGGRSRADAGASLGRRTDLATGGVVFEREVSAAHPSWLADHRVFDQVVVPGAWWGSLMLWAASRVDTAPQAAVEDLQLHAPLILEEGERHNLQIVLGGRDGDGGRSIGVYSRKDDQDTWTRHAEARVVVGAGPAPLPDLSPAPSETGSPVPDHSPAPSETGSPVPSLSPAPSETDSPVPSLSPAPSETDSPVPSLSPAPSETGSPVPSLSPAPSETGSPVPGHSPAPSGTDSPVPSLSPAPSETGSPVPGLSPAPKETGSRAPDLSPAPREADSPIPGTRLRESFARAGLVYGPAFRGIETYRPTADGAVAEIVPTADSGGRAEPFHPTMLDAAIQTALATAADAGDALYLPIGWRRLWIADARPERVWCHVFRHPADSNAEPWQGTWSADPRGPQPLRDTRPLSDDPQQDTWSADLRLLDDAGDLYGELVGLVMRRASRSTLLSAGGGLADLLHEVIWQECPLPSAPPPAGIRLARAVAAGSADPPSFRDAESLDGEQVTALGDALRQLACAWARATLDDLGWRPETGARIDPASLRRELRVVREHEPLLRRLFDLLGESGLLAPAEGGWIARPGWPELADPVSLTSVFAAQLPQGSTEIDLLARCGAALGDVLRGRAEPDAVLKGSGIRDPIDLAREAPLWRAALHRALRPLAAMAEAVPENERLTVLAVGSPAISELVPEIAPSPAMEVAALAIDAADRARPEHWLASDRPGVRLHVERSAARDQGEHWSSPDRLATRFPDDGRPSSPPDRDPDVVLLPAGLLREAPDPGVILERCRSILAPSGCLLVLDDGRREGWLDLCFGLRPSWWRHAGGGGKDGSPGSWRDALQAVGFTETAVCPAGAAPERTVPEIVLVPGRAPARRPEAAGTWILHAGGGDDADTLMAELAGDLAERGQTVAIVVAGDGPAGETSGANRIGIRPDSRDSWRSFFDGLDADPPLRGVVASIGSFRNDVGEDPDRLAGEGPDRSAGKGSDRLAGEDPGRLAGEVNRIATRVLALMQGLVDAGAAPPAGVSFVTRGGRTTGRERRSAMAPSILWGMVRTAAREVPRLRPRLIDLDPDAVPRAAELAAEAFRPDDESLVAWRAGARLVPRLSPAGAAAPRLRLPPDEVWHVAADPQGSLDGLRVATSRPTVPGPGEVRVRIEAAGLNFHDVLVALGLVDVGAPLGSEFCGTVLEAGPGVEPLAPGDRVVGFATPALAREAVVRAALVTGAPAGIPSAALAAMPIVFATALLAFRAAGLGPGQRVLVHSASGGVGHAAIRIARTLGAEVLATASAAKRAYVRGLGVEHVFDSRSTRFAAGVLEATEDRGVDVVLNSLTGEGFIEASLSCLARGGHFVEIAKRRIRSPARMAEVRPDVAYTVLAVDELIEREPERAGGVLHEVMAGVGDGAPAPLPLAVRPVTEAAAAMETMRAGRHVGKLVLTMPGLSGGRLRSAGPYLVSGGLGGLGLEVARWLIARGVRTIVLNARTAPDPATAAAIEAMREQGATVRVELADVADEAAVAAMLEKLARDLPPLAGVFHCAGVLADGALENQDPGRFERVLGPKTFGAWNLHCATRHLDLDHFVMFSSVAGVMGNPGQANYAAANAFLDQLAHHRRSLGLAGQSIAWGAWSGAGMAASRRARMDGWTGGWITPRQGLAALERILEQGPATMVVTALDRAALDARPELRSPFLERVLPASAAPAAPADDLPSRLRASPPAEREGLLVSFLQTEIRGVLGLPDLPPPRVGFFDLGMDSLTAIELRGRLSRALAGAGPVSGTAIFDHPDAISLARHLLHDLGLAVAAPTETEEKADAAARERARIGRLSGEALLAEMEARLGDRR